MDVTLPAVGGRRLLISHAAFERSALVCILEEQEKINPNNALIETLCNAVRLSREACDNAQVPLQAAGGAIKAAEELTLLRAEVAALKLLREATWCPDATADEIGRLRAELGSERRVHELDIDQRDLAQDALEEAYYALGGDREDAWICRVPEPAPPDSGDLHKDVPVLAVRLCAAVERLTKERDEAIRADEIERRKKE